MRLKELKRQLKKNVSDGYLEEALSTLEQYLSGIGKDVIKYAEEKHDETVLSQGQLSNLQLKQRAGTIGHEEASREQRRLNERFLSLVNSLEPIKDRPIPVAGYFNIRRKWVLFPVILLLLLILWRFWPLPASPGECRIQTGLSTTAYSQPRPNATKVAKRIKAGAIHKVIQKTVYGQGGGRSVPFYLINDKQHGHVWVSHKGVLKASRACKG